MRRSQHQIGNYARAPCAISDYAQLARGRPMNRIVTSIS